MENYTTHIKSKTGWFDIDIGELYKYRDLIFLFYKRNYTTRYKQTILGPAWLILKPLTTVILQTLVFGGLAGLAADGVPSFVFYLCGNALWTFFATCLTQTSGTFTDNAAIMGKVYFPRLVMPVSSVLTSGLDFIIQLVMLALVMAGFALNGYSFDLGPVLLLAPVIILQTGILGLGCGIIVASLTTKYRDLRVLMDFGVQLWMYATPVVYTAALIPSRFFGIYMLNPMAAIMECWRNSVIGCGEFLWGFWGISWIVTILVLIIGVLIFS
nr:ABC transporter permease [Lachnospiraceae bacterium]